jgi:hypothetical protein
MAWTKTTHVQRAICRSVGVFLAGLALCSLASPVRAWNSTGHMTIAAIAYDHLTPTAKARVDALLVRHRDYGLWMRQKPAAYLDKARFAFEKAATWPDDIRGTSDSHPTWHYIDLPVIAPGYTPGSSALLVPTPNAETQITAETAVLTAPEISAGERAVALCWVAHLIGDIHQPLHAATFVSALFPQGDRGGNTEALAAGAIAGDPVEAAAAPQRLHALWDDALGAETDPAVIDVLARSLETASYARSTFPQLTQDTTVQSWAQESHALAQEVVYIDGTLPITEAADHATVTLPPAYLETLHAVANRQIALAGLRLADTLNAALVK